MVAGAAAVSANRVELRSQAEISVEFLFAPKTLHVLSGLAVAEGPGGSLTRNGHFKGQAAAQLDLPVQHMALCRRQPQRRIQWFDFRQVFSIGVSPQLHQPFAARAHHAVIAAN